MSMVIAVCLYFVLARIKSSSEDGSRCRASNFTIPFDIITFRSENSTAPGWLYTLLVTEGDATIVRSELSNYANFPSETGLSPLPC
jgi:hypothetical protein